VTVIRRLQSGDAHALAAFYNGLSPRSKRTFRPLGETTTLDACQAIVEDNVFDKDRFDLVATVQTAAEKSTIVGWSFLWSLGSPEPTFGLCVADGYQKKGLGGQLMDRVIAEAGTRGLAQVHLTVVQDNVVAQGMYERRGFVRCRAFVGDDGLPYYGMVRTSNVDCTQVQDRFRSRA
jgi:ribosomal protein S18 acetylase RimI-like enzyme